MIIQVILLQMLCISRTKTYQKCFKVMFEKSQRGYVYWFSPTLKIVTVWLPRMATTTFVALLNVLFFRVQAVQEIIRLNVGLRSFSNQPMSRNTNIKLGMSTPPILMLARPLVLGLTLLLNLKSRIVRRKAISPQVWRILRVSWTSKLNSFFSCSASTKHLKKCPSFTVTKIDSPLHT